MCISRLKWKLRVIIFRINYQMGISLTNYHMKVKKKKIIFFFVLGIEKSHSVEILNYRDDLKCIKSNLEIDDERPCVKCNIF